MGSDNLNRAFIKAFGKGGANNSEANPPESAKVQDQLIVRFDTATVSVPSPHLFTPPQKPTQSTPSSIPASQDQPTSSAKVANAARNEPLAASVPPNHIASAAAKSDQEITQWDETMYSLLFGGATTMVAPNTVLAATKSQPIVNQAPSAEGPRRSSEAATRASANQARSTQDVARANTSQDLAHRISSKNQGGEIFRLDRPSYANDAASNGADAFDDESPTAYDMELQRQMMAHSATQHTPQVPPRKAMPTLESDLHSAPSRESMQESTLDDHQQNLAKTKYREQVLRHSRMKIFNPLWEVDRLQWPKVCQELSKTMDEVSAPVMENLMKACQEGLQVLAITSPQSGEGTSTVACCLAMLAGKRGMNVALVDSNIENPSLSYQTNLELDVDWHEAVAKRLPLEEIAVHSVDDQVTLVPLLERLNAPELNENNVARMLQELANSFDLVIVDLGNMSAPRNMVRKLGELGVINAVVAVVDRRLSSPDRIESCLRQIRQTGIASIGLVENFAA